MKKEKKRKEKEVQTKEEVVSPSITSRRKFLYWLIFIKLQLIHLDTYLQRLEDGPAVGGQLGVGSLAEELGEGSDGVQFVC